MLRSPRPNGTHTLPRIISSGFYESAIHRWHSEPLRKRKAFRFLRWENLRVGRRSTTHLFCDLSVEGSRVSV